MESKMAQNYLKIAQLQPKITKFQKEHFHFIFLHDKMFWATYLVFRYIVAIVEDI